MKFNKDNRDFVTTKVVEKQEHLIHKLPGPSDSGNYNSNYPNHLQSAVSAPTLPSEEVCSWVVAMGVGGAVQRC